MTDLDSIYWTRQQELKASLNSLTARVEMLEQALTGLTDSHQQTHKIRFAEKMQEVVLEKVIGNILFPWLLMVVSVIWKLVLG